MSLCVDRVTGKWYDFGARTGGSLFGLVKLTLGLPSIKSAQDYVGQSDFVLPFAQRHRYELDEIKRFDKTLLLKLCKDHSYWLNRHVSVSTVSTFEGGTTNNGRMRHRYVFPILDDKDELIGFSGRILDDTSNLPKWKHIGAKSNWCYPLRWNHPHIIKSRKVILVESIGDMLALWEAGIYNVLVTFGVDISAKVIEYLLKIDATRVIIAFNNDADNNMVGNEAAEEGKLQLIKYFDEPQIIVGTPEQKDFGEMNEGQISAWQTKFLTN
jgi:DNA primase